jgi:hypothetical protein
MKWQHASHSRIMVLTAVPLPEILNRQYDFHDRHQSIFFQPGLKWPN